MATNIVTKKQKKNTMTKDETSLTIAGAT